MRLDADQDNIEGLLIAARGSGVGEESFNIRSYHGKEGLVEVGAYIGIGRRVEVGCEFGDSVSKTGAVLGGNVDGDAEGLACTEEFERGRDPD